MPSAEKAEPKEKAESPVKKIAPPSIEEQKRLIAAIDEVYKPGEAKDQATQVALARKLLEEGRKNEANRSEQFVMFRRSGEIASDAGEAELMLEAVDAMTAAGFNVQPIPLKARLLKQLVEQGSSSGACATFGSHASCVTFAEQAAVNDAVEEASGVIDAAHKVVANRKKLVQQTYRTARTAVARTRNPADKAAREQKAREAETELWAIESALSALAECAENLQQARHEQEAVRSARERLKTEPDDSNACLAVGRWFCFYRGDWDSGLKLLAKGSDGSLKSLAAQELASKPSKAEDKVARGDAWWDLGEKATGKAKAAMRRRAGHWYAEAMPNLTPGLAKAKVEGRLAQAFEEPTDPLDSLQVKKGKFTVTIQSRSTRPVLTYAFDDVPFKPYVKELFTPGGVQDPPRLAARPQAPPRADVRHQQPAGSTSGRRLRGVASSIVAGAELARRADAAILPGHATPASPKKCSGKALTRCPC